MKPVHDGNIKYKTNPVNNIDTTSNLDNMGKVGKIFLISIFNVVFVGFYIIINKLPMAGLYTFLFLFATFNLYMTQYMQYIYLIMHTCKQKN